MSDFDKAVDYVVETLLKGKTEPFRSDLVKVAREAGLSSTPKRKLRNLFDDILTLNSVVDKVGYWCLAEIEGCQVQFNPIVSE